MVRPHLRYSYLPDMYSFDAPIEQCYYCVMLRAIKVRLYPTNEQAQALAFQFGAMRWVYNYALAWRSEAGSKRGESVSKRQTLDRLVSLKRDPETAWLKQADSQGLQQSVIHLDEAMQRFFRKQGRYPRFKSRHDRQSLSYPQRVKVVADGRALRLPKVGDVKAVVHRDIVGKIKTVTVSRTQTGKYFASILCEDALEAPDKINAIAAADVVGVDLGVKHLAVESTGAKQSNPRFLKRAAANLRRKQKALSRKQAGSANRAEARLRVAKAHEKTKNARNDFQHKLSRRLIDENQAVCVETLKVKNMLQNRQLSKHIADAAWGELVRKLEYKANWTGKRLVRIDPWFASSKTCSTCGEKVAILPLDIRRWQCQACGQQHDRDVNAAENIRRQGILKLRAEGLSVSACGGSRKTGIMPAAA